jgi:coenzyme PQQ precursor peptide PqqA
MAKGPGREDKACAKRAAIPAFLCCSQLSGKRGQATALNRVGFSDTFGNVIMPSIRETANGWKPPQIVEVPVGMEINLYACAAQINDRPPAGRCQPMTKSLRTRREPGGSLDRTHARRSRRHRCESIEDQGTGRSGNRAGVVHLNPETEAMDFERSGSSASTRPVPHDPSSQSADA